MRVAQKEQKFLVLPRENWDVSIPEMKRTHTHTLGWKRLKKSSSNSFWVRQHPKAGRNIHQFMTKLLLEKLQ